MIPSKSKTLLMTCCGETSRSLMLNWVGLGLALVFLAFATVTGV